MNVMYVTTNRNHLLFFIKKIWIWIWQIYSFTIFLSYFLYKSLQIRLLNPHSSCSCRFFSLTHILFIHIYLIQPQSSHLFTLISFIHTLSFIHVHIFHSLLIISFIHTYLLHSHSSSSFIFISFIHTHFSHSVQFFPCFILFLLKMEMLYEKLLLKNIFYLVSINRNYLLINNYNFIIFYSMKPKVTFIIILLWV